MNGSTPIHVHRSTIYLVRHGECVGNVSQVNMPPDEDVLTDTGKSQAEQLGKHLKDVVFTRAYASNYPRARDTAKHVLANSNMQSKPELKIDERIREREMGKYVGKSAGEAFKEFFAAVKNGTPMHKFDVPGAETAAEFDGRIDGFVDELFKELKANSKPETILIVSHGITILRLMSKLRDPTKGLSLQSWTFNRACMPMKNTAYHLFTIDVPSPDCPDKDKKIHLEFLSYHQRKHLGEEDEVDMSLPNQVGPLGLALLKLRELDTSAEATKECALQ